MSGGVWGGVLGWGLRNSVYVWFGSKDPELDSQENNGKEGVEREVYGCVRTHTGGRHTGGRPCVHECPVH